MAVASLTGLGLAIALAWAASPVAQPEDIVAVENVKPSLHGFIDVNAYYDTRAFSALTLNLLVNLPLRLQYFSLTNYQNGLGAASTDLAQFYSEQNLRWNPFASVPIDLAAQWVIRSDDANDLLRPGLLWRAFQTPGLRALFRQFNLTYFVTFYVTQFEPGDVRGWRGQIEHVYGLRIWPKVLDDRVYLSGFLDHSLWAGGGPDAWTSRVVTEHQVGVRIVAGLHGVVEYRYNQFLDDAHGVGFGLQYKAAFMTGKQ